jgi:hypothetical protein
MVEKMTLTVWKRMCPYGCWTCDDGRQVLFNRQYWPILERVPGGPARAADPNEWVEDVESSESFFDDSSSPWRRVGSGGLHKKAQASLRRVNKVLKEWNLLILDPPPEPEPVPPGPLIISSAIEARSNPWELILFEYPDSMREVIMAIVRRHMPS